MMDALQMYQDGGFSIQFLDRIEDSIVLKNISNSIQRYQEAIADTKRCLDFAMAQGVWLMPSRMVINTESIVGYNNMLVISDGTMKFCVNNNVNRESHKASIKLMGDGPSKIKPLNNHPLNLIHKQATEAQGLAEKKKPTQTPVTSAPPTQTTITQPTKTTTTDSVDSHHVNNALVVMGALAFVGLIYAFS